jgi:DNA-binding MarR family transcriptional regulator
LQRLVVGFNHDIAELLKAHGVSAPQFNILRILRGARHQGSGGGLAAGEICARLIAHAPDLTRLLDRMAAQGLVVRAREESDRRVVTARITDKGLALLAALDAPLAELHKGHLGHLGPERLRALKDLLEAARPQPTSPIEEHYED